LLLVIASEAKQSIEAPESRWIASSLALLAMTGAGHPKAVAPLHLEG
jgi:hypothetical protein